MLKTFRLPASGRGFARPLIAHVILTQVIAAATLVAPLCVLPSLQAQEIIKTVEVDVAPSLVTVYRDRARVARQYRATLAPGDYQFRFGGLPDTAESESVQAQARGGRVAGVSYGLRRHSAPAAQPAAERDVAELDRQHIFATDQRELIQDELEFLNHLSMQIAADLATAPDATAVEERMAFLTELRTPVLDRRRAVDIELSRIARRRDALADATATPARTLDPTATVDLVVETTSEVTVTLSYFVASATWKPRYNIRADRDGSRTLRIEYDAVVTQSTGEDWNGVELVLSTALRADASEPPTLEPWFLDVTEPSVGSETSSAPPQDQPVAMGSTADFSSGDPTLTFVVPRRHSVKDGAKDERVRIATIDAGGAFVHVAVPLVSDQTFVRAEMANRSGLELLPAPASLFVGQDYVGLSTVGSVPPHAAFDLYFGTDPAVTVRRAMLSTNTIKTGLLGGGRRTVSAYGITVENRAGKPIALELWDRILASLADTVEVILAETSHTVDSDDAYLTNDRSRGLLRWTLDVPAAPTTFDLTYRVEIVRPKDVEVTHVRE